MRLLIGMPCSFESMGRWCLVKFLISAALCLNVGIVPRTSITYNVLVGQTLIWPEDSAANRHSAPRHDDDDEAHENKDA